VVGDIDHVKRNKMGDNSWDNDRGNVDMAELPKAVADLSDVDAVNTENIFAIVVRAQGACPEEDDDEPDAACKLDEETDDQYDEESPDHGSLLEDSAQEPDETDKSSECVYSSDDDDSGSHILGQATELLRCVGREDDEPHQTRCSARNKELEECENEHSKSEGKTAAEFGGHS